MSKTYRKQKRKKSNRSFDKKQWNRLNDTKIYESVEWDQFDLVKDTNIVPDVEWRSINWKVVERKVFKLQKLIFKASSRGDISFPAQVPKASDQKLLRKVTSC